MEKIKQKDLRPGNWIYKKGFEEIVTPLYTAKKKKNFYFLVTEDNIKDVINNLDDYEGIFINEKAMAHLGFSCKPYKDGVFTNNLYKINVNGKTYSIDDDCPYFDYYNDIDISYMDRIRLSNNPLDYIHLIQNAYFDFTGKFLPNTFNKD